MHPEALDKNSRSILIELQKFPEFYLAGGTALALQIGHRISVDFDFFSEEKIEKALLQKVTRVFPKTRIGISVNNPDELTIFINEVKVTFLRYPFPLLLDQVIYEGVRLLSVREIATTKAYTIGRRGSYKDYIDLYYIFSEHHAMLKEIIGLAEQKYGGEFNARLFLEQLIYLSDVEDTEIKFLREGPADKAAVENFFTAEIKKLEL